MKKLILSTAIFCLASSVCELRAQSITNKSWTTFIGAPINDSAILHIYQDSSFITNTKGQVMVHFRTKITSDTITISDYGAEEQGCTDVVGNYKINLSADSFTLTMIKDECDGRSEALTHKTWRQAKGK